MDIYGNERETEKDKEEHIFYYKIITTLNYWVAIKTLGWPSKGGAEQARHVTRVANIETNVIL